MKDDVDVKIETTTFLHCHIFTQEELIHVS